MGKINRYYRHYLAFGALIIIFIGSYFLLNNFRTSQVWQYTFQGSSQQWEGQFVITPSRDKSEVFYVGSIKPLRPMKINQLTFKTDLVTGQPSGTMDSPLVEEGKPLQIFVTVPGHDSIQFRAGMNSEEITQIFYRDLVYEITWNDEIGQHNEKIVLKLVPPS